MILPTEELQFEVEMTGQSGGHCDCCGNDSHCVWGWVHQIEGPTVAAYWVRWTDGHLADPGAKLDLVIGPWGEGTSQSARYLVSLVHREQQGESPALMVVDAPANNVSYETLAQNPMAKGEVIGTPLAAQLFRILDAIYEQDTRFF
ncbi:hypothetical protein [uncultured Erythrobacter sp.]|uniref:hypothetical protein n=1 Tax=uncultured Erythrobacter sp. TaxID=263913 RepID=UPI002637A2C9|nr:hypothetical protein [uncultured Erythrobacter sp.]